MPVTVRIPSPLRGLTNGESTVEAGGKSVSEVLLDLEAKYPGIGDKLYDKESLRPLFHIYLNDEDIRVLDKAEGQYKIDIKRAVREGDQLSIIPPIAGGIWGRFKA